jgi:hypothetical protein
LAGIVFGLILGIFTARSSAKRDPIYGGIGSKALHYLMASAITAMPATILALALQAGLVFAILVAVGFAIFLQLMSLVFGAVENPARRVALQAQTDRGWTEEDARASGL